MQFERTVLFHDARRNLEANYLSWLGSAVELGINRYVCSVADPAENIATIQNEARPGDLWISNGGDGMHLLVAKAMREIDEADQPTIMATKAGSACDWANAHLGELDKKHSLVRFMETAHEITVHPLDITIEEEDGDKVIEETAMVHAGFGLSGVVATAIETPEYRYGGMLRAIPVVGDKLKEAVTGIKNLRDAVTYKIYIDGGTRDIVDLSLGHNNRVAKYGRLPVASTDPYFLKLITEDPRLPVMIQHVNDLTKGRAEYTRETEVVFETGNAPMACHFDGQASMVKPRSRVTARLSTLSVKELAAPGFPNAQV